MQRNACACVWARSPAAIARALELMSQRRAWRSCSGVYEVKGLLVCMMRSSTAKAQRVMAGRSGDMRWCILPEERVQLRERGALRLIPLQDINACRGNRNPVAGFRPLVVLF